MVSIFIYIIFLKLTSFSLNAKLKITKHGSINQQLANGARLFMSHFSKNQLKYGSNFIFGSFSKTYEP